MSKFKVEFTLKQHTPIIHFQSEQTGATLRATELKPKFDRFIKYKLKYINKNLYDKYKHIIEDEAIFPQDKGSNSYKISIEHSSNNKIETPKAYVNTKKETDKTAYQSPYFADASKSIFTTGEIKISIKSFNKELLELLDASKDYIFIYENFGTRQSKGFGSFLRSDISQNEIKSILQQYDYPIFELASYKDYKHAFMSIDTFYKKLKMGINKPYFKSLLFQYVCQTYNYGWEKKFIKNKFPEVIHGEHKPLVCKEPDDQEFRYIRAVLGLAEHNEFRPTGGKKQVKIKNKTIERFQSPITFKVFNQHIYILYNESYKELLGKQFDFSLKGKNEQLSVLENFDMYKFFKFVEKQNIIKELSL